MKESTKKRFQLIEYIITTIGNEGRDIKADYLNDCSQQLFKDKSQSEYEFGLFFDSQIQLLINGYKLIYQKGNLIGLTDKGIEVYELEHGFYGYIKQRNDEQRKAGIDFIAKVAGAIAAILATAISAYSVWKGYKFPVKDSLLFFGASCFILGFVLKGLVVSLLEHLWRYLPKRVR